MENTETKPSTTNGEWKVKPSVENIDTFCILNEQDYQVAKTETRFYQSKDEAEANAQRIVKCVNGWDGLIATIKEMLKEAEDACTFHGNNPDKSPDIIKWRNFLKQAEQK